jgi:hypothetical protein
MADVAHDLSGPASPKPDDLTPQQASRPDSADRGKLRVFISYSRDDLRFADQLNAALNAYGFECFIDRQGISGGEDWKGRLGNLIRDADTVVFVLSPSSAGSEICAWEVEESARLGKRILPVVCRPLAGASPPPRLRDLNYIFFYEDPKVRMPASAPASRSWSWLSTPTSIGCASTPATFSARPSGTGAVGQRTGCCQATILPKQRLGRRDGPRVRPNPHLCT